MVTGLRLSCGWYGASPIMHRISQFSEDDAMTHFLAAMALAMTAWGAMPTLAQAQAQAQAQVQPPAPTCHAAAADKRIHGAAKTSFMAKCERDAAAACESQATDRKIYGAAKTSFLQKCVKDAVGAPPAASS